MRRTVAAVGSAAFFVLAPGVVAGIVPWWLTGWQMREALPYWAPLRVVGGTLLVGGTLVLIYAFVQFVGEGVGTPAPIAPTERLVTGGLYRYVRNPMYLAVIATIVGQALLLGRIVLFLYALAVGLAFSAFVRGTHPRPPLRRRVRGLPSCGTPLVATLAALADPGAVRDLWARYVPDGRDLVRIHVQLQHRGPMNGLAIHLPFGLRTAFEQDPRGLDRVGVADAQRNLTGMFAGKPLDNLAYATPELLNRFIAGQ